MSAEYLKISDVMEAYMDKVGLNQEDFASALTSSLVNINISRVSVTNWCNSISAPNTDFLLVCLAAYTDWRRNWAWDCLRAKLPEVFDAGIVTVNLPKVPAQ